MTHLPAPAAGPAPGGGIRLGLIGDLIPGPAGPRPEQRARAWAALDDCDLILANLECAVTDRTTPQGRKRFNLRTPAATLDLFDPRFVLGLANNHVLDFGTEGLADTQAALESHALAHAGAGRNRDAARRPVLREVHGVRVAFICAADPRYAADDPDAPGPCPATPEILRDLLREWRGRADHLVVSVHLGMEHVPYPTPLMRRLADLCRDEGAGVVVFHHAHVPGGHTADARGVILWGAGNYVFDHAEWRGPVRSPDAAAWILRLGVPPTPPHLECIAPLTLAPDGWARPAAPAEGARLLRTLARRTAHTRHPAWAALHRTLYLARPSYLRIAGGNYRYMARAQGWGAVTRSIASTLRLQFFGNRPGTGG